MQGTVRSKTQFRRDWDEVTGRLKMSGVNLNKILLVCECDRADFKEGETDELAGSDEENIG